MREKTRSFLMKLIAVTAIFSSLYPITRIGRIYLFQINGSSFDFIIAITLVLLGYLAPFIIIRGKSSIIRIIAVNIAFIIPTPLVILVSPKISWIHMIFELLLAFLFYFIGARIYFSQYLLILDDKKVSMCVVMMLVSLLTVNYLHDFAQLRTLTFIMAFVFMLFSMIFTNQCLIDKFTKKDSKSSSVIKNIRGYNAIATFIIFALILISFNFKNIVLFLFKIIWIIGGFFFWLLTKIMSLGFHVKGNSQTIRPEGGGIGIPINFPFIKIIIAVLLIALVYLFFFKMKGFRKKFRVLLSAIYQMLAGLFKKKDGDLSKDEYFSDEIEKLAITKEEKKLEKPKIKAANGKRNIKVLERIAKPDEKIRYYSGENISKYT